MADRIVVMSKGRIEQLGTPLEIYNRPATRFVAGFFGMPTMNFLEGVVETGSAGPRFRGAGTRAGAAGVPLHQSRRAQGLVLGVRSEHVVIDGAASIPGTARLLQPLGDATLVHFDAGGGQFPGREGCARHGSRARLAAEVPLRPEHCHLFDAATGQRRM